VTAVVELKARFDEGHNIDWARKMEEAGVNSVFGFVQWKIHCKATLIVSAKAINCGVTFMSPPATITQPPRNYTQISVFLPATRFRQYVSALFNVLTGLIHGSAVIC